jgi:major type 1 subunit fimbrin (pilin)
MTTVANAADGTINFSGSIRDTACVVDTGSAAQNVPLGEVSKAGFVNAGDVSGAGNIKITLTSCDPLISRAAVRFDGARAAGDSRILALTPGTGPDAPAVGIGIAIFESDSSTLIPLGVKSAGIALTAPAGGELEFVAKYMATTELANITPGNGAGTATFTLDYN